MSRVRADGVPIDPARYASPTKTELENSRSLVNLDEVEQV